MSVILSQLYAEETDIPNKNTNIQLQIEIRNYYKLAVH